MWDTWFPLPGTQLELRGKEGRRKVDDLIYSKQKPTTLPAGRQEPKTKTVNSAQIPSVSIFGEGISRGKDY